MAEFDTIFRDAMLALEDRGLDFSLHAKKTLSEVLGPAASEPFLVLLGMEALNDPKLFAEGTSRFLGGGFIAICMVLGRSAIEDVQGSRSIPAVREFESKMPYFERTSKYEPEGKKSTPLHDHRIKDQLDAYAEDA